MYSSNHSIRKLTLVIRRLISSKLLVEDVKTQGQAFYKSLKLYSKQISLKKSFFSLFPSSLFFSFPLQLFINVKNVIRVNSDIAYGSLDSTGFKIMFSGNPLLQAKRLTQTLVMTNLYKSYIIIQNDLRVFIGTDIQ